MPQERLAWSKYSPDHRLRRQCEKLTEVVSFHEKVQVLAPSTEYAVRMKRPKTKPGRPDRSAGESAPHHKVHPDPQEMDALAALFNQGQYAEAATLAKTLTLEFPRHGFGWKALAAVLVQTGRSAEAFVPMQKAAALSPGDAEVHNNLGVLLKKLGRLDEAEATLRQALKIKPDYADALSNLGATLKDLGRLVEAETSLRQALEIKPDFAGAHSNLGNVLRDLGRLDDAVSSYHRALNIKPDFAEAHCNLGVTLKELDRLAEAKASYRHALQIKPDYADAYAHLGAVYRDQGRLNEALACFQQQVRLAPGDAAARHHVASLTGNNTERAPIQYVERVFDAYADKFDTHLPQVLQYETPDELVALVTQHSTPSAENWNVLDLGCGTGLVGVAIAPFARQLVGVDLSTKMLNKARARNLYQRLERSDLLAMMRDEQTSSYDVIIAADVFVYLGKLDAIVGEIKRLLCPGGVLAFSIEAMQPLSVEEASQVATSIQEYQLENTGRYTHSVSYLTSLASDNGFQGLELAATQIRLERGKPVNGYLVLWKS